MFYFNQFFGAMYIEIIKIGTEIKIGATLVWVPLIIEHF